MTTYKKKKTIEKSTRKCAIEFIFEREPAFVRECKAMQGGVKRIREQWRRSFRYYMNRKRNIELEKM